FDPRRAAGRFHPFHDRRGACSSRFGRLHRFAARDVEEIDGAFGQRRPERVHSGAGRPRVAQIEYPKLLHRPKFFESCVGDLAEVKIQLFDLGQPGELIETGVGDWDAEQVQFGEVRKFLQVNQARVRYTRAVEVKLGKVAQPADVLQSFIGDHRVPQVELR